jgi:hypothetical protein
MKKWGKSGFISQGVLCHKVEDLTIGRASYGDREKQGAVIGGLASSEAGKKPSLCSWGKRATQPKSHTWQAWAYRLGEELH